MGGVAVCEPRKGIHDESVPMLNRRMSCPVVDECEICNLGIWSHTKSTATRSFRSEVPPSILIDENRLVVDEKMLILDALDCSREVNHNKSSCQLRAGRASREGVGSVFHECCDPMRLRLAADSGFVNALSPIHDLASLEATSDRDIVCWQPCRTRNIHQEMATAA